MMNTETQKRVVRLADIESVKWVTGCFRDRSIETRRLTAEEIAEIADLPMHQPYPAEPGTWANVNMTGQYITVMAIVATDATERGAGLVASGETYTEDQNQGLAIGCYAEQQSRLANQTGECSEGCSQAQTVVAPREIHVNESFVTTEARQVCRHTLIACRSCEEIPTAKRIELLERLLINVRPLVQFDVGQPGRAAIVAIVNQLDGSVKPSLK